MVKTLCIVSSILLSASRLYASGEIQLEEFLGKYGLKCSSSKDGIAVYSSRHAQLQFKDKSRMMEFNGSLVWLNKGAVSGLAGWTVCRDDAEKVIAPLLRGRDYAARIPKPAIVLIDPGHGGEQNGARPESGPPEKELCLDIARRVRDKLITSGVSTALTRDADISLSLPERCRSIGRLGADVFVSIHLNFAGNPQAEGVETYLLPAEGHKSTSLSNGDTRRVVGNRNDEMSGLLSYLVHRDLLRFTRAADRGVKRARYDVLADAICPALLVECGFMSNKEENSRLQSGEYRDKVASGIASGIIHYIELW